MARSINFVRDRRRKLTKTEQRDKQLFVYALYLLGAVFGVFLLVLAARMFMVFQVKSIKDQQADTRAAILAREDVEKSYTIFANKLTILTELYNKRKAKQDALEFFGSVFGPDVIVSQLTYSQESEALSFVLTTQSIFILEGVFDTLRSQQVITRYPSIQKAGLRRSADGTYGMKLSIMLGEDVSVGTQGANE